MTELSAQLTKKTGLRKAVAELTIAELEKLLADLNDIYQGRLAEEQQKIEQLKEKDAAINDVLAQMAARGLSLEDLQSVQGEVSTKNAVVKKRNKVLPAYRCVDLEGHEWLWTGRGREPKAFTEAMAREGKIKDDYRIPEEERALYAQD